jgi:hypothetical protein
MLILSHAQNFFKMWDYTYIRVKRDRELALTQF